MSSQKNTFTSTSKFYSIYISYLSNCKIIHFHNLSSHFLRNSKNSYYARDIQTLMGSPWR